jgi:zinc protease
VALLSRLLVKDAKPYFSPSLLLAASKLSEIYHNEEQIINAFESLGAQFSNYSLKDMSIVSLRTLSREPILRKALNIFTEVVTQPSFEQTYLGAAQ